MTGSSNSRGIRNNNPHGNIRWGDDWKGLVPEGQRTDKSFCQFKAPEFGIRAMIANSSQLPEQIWSENHYGHHQALGTAERE